MTKAISFVRLDFITVKSYLTIKTLAIMIAAPLVILISTGVSTMSISMFMVFAALYISYPFAIGDKNCMDALYQTLSITRNTVVIGRYLFTLTFDLCAGIVGIIVTFIMAAATKTQIDYLEAIFTLLSMFVVVTIIEAVQLPIYFKLGYEKAKFAAYLPFMGVMLAALAIMRFLPKDVSITDQLDNILGWASANPYLTALLAAFIWLGIMVVSYQISLSFYRKRDF